MGSEVLVRTMPGQKLRVELLFDSPEGAFALGGKIVRQSQGGLSGDRQGSLSSGRITLSGGSRTFAVRQARLWHRAGRRDPDRLEADDLRKGVEVAVIVQHSRHGVLCGGGEEVVDER